MTVNIFRLLGIFAAVVAILAQSSCKPSAPTTVSSPPPPPPPPKPAEAAGAPTANTPAGPKGPKMSPEARAQRRMDRLTKALDLTPDQVTKIKAIMDEQMAVGQAAVDQSNLTPEEKLEKVRQARTEFDAKIAPILTPEQKTKFDAFRQQMQQHRPEGGGMPEAGGPAPGGQN